VIPVQVPLTAATFGSPLMVCTSAAVKSVLAAALPLLPLAPVVPEPALPFGVEPVPDDVDVGVVELPQPAIQRLQ
jgi:hypothetical protein